MSSSDELNQNAGLPDRRNRRRRRRPERAAEYFGTNFQFRPRFDVMEDRTLLSSFLVSTTADSGPGSLRQAILDSNAANDGANTIDFDIPGSGVQTILPQSPLPGITQEVLIDGTSQPGYGGTPLIELSGSQAGGGDGLDIDCSNVTVRGLDINGFSQGAGVLISGTNAIENTISSNVIGTDPSGSQPLGNEFGVEIVAGANDNTIGGATAAAGNLIAFNSGPGVDVEGTSSIGNQITANRMFSDDLSPSATTAGALEFDGSTYVSLPNGVFNGSEESTTLEAWFKTTTGGVILGYQGASPENYPGNGWVPSLYVGTDGRLYGGSYDPYNYSLVQITSNSTVNDGQWHNVALVTDGVAQKISLYLDGQLVGSASGLGQTIDGSFNQIGMGYTDGWPATPGGWYGFVGQISDVSVWSGARSAGQISQDATTALTGTEPGLQAAYTFEEGQGYGAHDLTPNHNDGTLSGSGGDYPAWVALDGAAIELGDEGITYNATSPGEGPNDLQNFPIIATAADGQLEGWLGGSTPRRPSVSMFSRVPAILPTVRARPRITSGHWR